MIATERQPARDVNYTFDDLMAKSEALGIRSSFYFIAGRTAGDFDGSYEIGDRAVRDLIGKIYARGHEIGLHPSYGTYRSSEALTAEFRRLRGLADELRVTQAEWGGRQHYLRWEAPITWRLWADAGIDYDSSVGYADIPGFRCGTSREFSVFDVRERRRLALRERPLVAMDVSFTSREYLALDVEKSAERLMQLIDQCRMYDGDFTLLWHNDRLVYPEDRRLYDLCLAMLA
jgi:hypothetical protein